MPMAIPAAIGIGGALFSALGSSKAKTQQQQQNTSNQNQFTTSNEEFSKAGEFSQTQGQQGTTLPIEDPLSYLFRSGLFDIFGSEYQKANKPVYGEAQKAGFLNDLNELSRSSMESLRGQLGAVGAGDSGRYASGAADIERDRVGKYTDFLSQLPFLEEQSRVARVNPLLSFATNLAGLAPVGQMSTTTGSASGTSSESGKSSGTSNTTGSSSSTGTQTQTPPSFLSSLFTNLGGLGGLYAGSRLFDGGPKNIMNNDPGMAKFKANLRTPWD